MLIKNIFSNWAMMFVSIVIAFFMSPFLVHNLGKEQYGIWALVLSVISFSSFLDVGMNQSLAKYIPKHYAVKNFLKLNQVLSSTNAVYAFTGMLIIIGTFLAAFFLVGVFNVTEELRPVLRITLILIGLNEAVKFFFITRSALGPFHRYDIGNAIDILGAIANALVIVYFIGQGYKLITLAIITITTALIKFIVRSVYQKRLVPEVEYRFKYIDKQTIKELFEYGLVSFFIVIAWMLIFSSDNIIIGIFRTTTDVTYYSIALALITYLRTLMSSIGVPLVPVVSHLEATSKLGEINDDYDNASAISNSPDTFAAGIAVPTQLATDIDAESYTVELTSSVVESYTPLYYKFMLDSLENYPDPMITLDLLADVVATATYSELLTDITYYWRVYAVAVDNSDSSAWSSSTTFNLMTGVAQTLASTDCVFPLNGDIVASKRPYLEVNNLVDISEYYFQLSDNSQFDFPVESGAVAKSSGITTSWQVTDPLEHGQQYFWRASSDGSVWTSALAFSVELNIHTYPNPFRPTEGHSQIIFTNLPANTDLTISTISGNIVLRQSDIGPDDWAWDVKSENGTDLNSGIYLYSINSAAGATSGKVVVIR